MSESGRPVTPVPNNKHVHSCPVLIYDEDGVRIFDQTAP